MNYLPLKPYKKPNYRQPLQNEPPIPMQKKTSVTSTNWPQESLKTPKHLTNGQDKRVSSKKKQSSIRNMLVPTLQKRKSSYGQSPVNGQDTSYYSRSQCPSSKMNRSCNDQFEQFHRNQSASHQQHFYDNFNESFQNQNRQVNSRSIFPNGPSFTIFRGLNAKRLHQQNSFNESKRLSYLEKQGFQQQNLQSNQLKIGVEGPRTQANISQNNRKSLDRTLNKSQINDSGQRKDHLSVSRKKKVIVVINSQTQDKTVYETTQSPMMLLRNKLKPFQNKKIQSISIQLENPQIKTPSVIKDKSLFQQLQQSLKSQQSRVKRDNFQLQKGAPTQTNTQQESNRDNPKRALRQQVKSNKFAQENKFKALQQHQNFHKFQKDKTTVASELKQHKNLILNKGQSQDEVLQIDSSKMNEQNEQHFEAISKELRDQVLENEIKRYQSTEQGRSIDQIKYHTKQNKKNPLSGKIGGHKANHQNEGSHQNSYDLTVNPSIAGNPISQPRAGEEQLLSQFTNKFVKSSTNEQNMMLNSTQRFQFLPDEYEIQEEEDLGLEMRINMFMTEHFSQENQFTIEQVNLHWEQLKDVLKRDYMTLSYLNIFENVLRTFKIVVLNGLVDEEPFLQKNIMVTTFRALEDFYDVMSLDYNQLIEDSLYVLDYLRKKDWLKLQLQQKALQNSEHYPNQSILESFQNQGQQQEGNEKIQANQKVALETNSLNFLMALAYQSLFNKIGSQLFLFKGQSVEYLTNHYLLIVSQLVGSYFDYFKDRELQQENKQNSRNQNKRNQNEESSSRETLLIYNKCDIKYFQSIKFERCVDIIMTQTPVLQKLLQFDPFKNTFFTLMAQFRDLCINFDQLIIDSDSSKFLILSAFSAQFLVLKHPIVFQDYLDTEVRIYYEDLLNGFLNYLHKIDIYEQNNQDFFPIVVSLLKSLEKHIQQWDLFSYGINFQLSQELVKSCCLFMFLFIKRAKTQGVYQVYAVTGLLLDCFVQYISTKIVIDQSPELLEQFKTSALYLKEIQILASKEKRLSSQNQYVIQKIQHKLNLLNRILQINCFEKQEK